MHIKTEEIIELLKNRHRLSYRGILRRFSLDSEELNEIKNHLINVLKIAIDEDDRVIEYISQKSEQPINKIDINAQRRHITVMFCDIVGSTKLSESIDPEDLRKILKDYQEMCSQAITKFSGTIVQYLGDGILTYFGYPIAHEDDGFRAVSTAVAIIDELKNFNKRNRNNLGTDLAVRIGIHTGLTICGKVDNTNNCGNLALGEAPNISAKMQTFARPNEIVISKQTASLVQGFFNWEKENVPLINDQKDEPIYKIKGFSETVGSNYLFKNKHQLPFISRKHEIQVIQNAWNEAKKGAGKVISIAGEAGIGKSRILKEAIREITEVDGIEIINLHCSELYDNTPLNPFVRYFSRKFNILPENSEEDNWNNLNNIPQIESGVLDKKVAINIFSNLLSKDVVVNHEIAKDTRKKFIEKNILNLIQNLSHKKPLLITVEDIQFADPTSLDIIYKLIELTPSKQILLIINSRDKNFLDSRFEGIVTLLELKPLNKKDSLSLIENILQKDDLSKETIEAIADKTDGNPLFIEHFSQMIHNNNNLSENLTVSEHFHSIPITLENSLMARLDSSENAKEILQIGAVIGKSFSHEVICKLIPYQLDEKIKRLVDLNLLDIHVTTHGAHYSFKHDLVCDVAYQSMLRKTKNAFHLEIGKILSEEFSETTPPERIAYHFAKAKKWEKGVRYYIKAGEEANQIFNSPESLTHFEKAIKCAERVKDKASGDKLFLIANIKLFSSIISHKGFNAEELIDMAEAIEEKCLKTPIFDQWFQVLFAVYFYHIFHCNFTKAEKLCAAFSLNCSENNESKLLTNIAHGTYQFWKGNFLESKIFCEKAIPLYNNKKHQHTGMLIRSNLKVFCECHQLFNYWHSGEIHQVRELIENLIKSAEEYNHSFSQCNALISIASIYLNLGEYKNAEKYSLIALEISKKNKLTLWYAYCFVILGKIDCLKKDYNNGIKKIRRGIKLHKSSGSRLWLIDHLIINAECNFQNKNYPDAITALNEAEDILKTHSSKYLESEILRIKGEISYELEKDTEKSEALFNNSLDAAKQQNSKIFELKTAVSLSKLIFEKGDTEKAFKILTPIYTEFSEGFETEDVKKAKNLLSQFAK